MDKLKNEEQMEKMKFNEILAINPSSSIRKTIGGWIYTEAYEFQDSMGVSTTFIPEAL